MACRIGADGSAPASTSAFLPARLSEKGIHVVVVPVAVSASLLGLSASRLWKAASAEEAWDALTFSLFSIAVLLGLFTHFREDDCSKGARACTHNCTLEDSLFSNPLETVEQPDDNDNPPALPVPEDEEEVPEEEVPALSATPLVTLSPDPIPTEEEVHVPPPPPPRETIKAKTVKKVRFAKEIATVRIFHPAGDTETEEQQQAQHQKSPLPPFPATNAGRHRKDSMGSSNAITVYLANPPTHKVVRLQQQKMPQQQHQHQEEEDEVNSKAEAFIARFREQLRMQ